MSETKKATIPPPREGLLGEWDKFVGPGAARWENAGTLGFAAVGAVAAPAMVRRQRPEANPLELAAASAMGLDIAGGAWCNETPTSKRWCHRARRQHPPGAHRLRGAAPLPLPGRARQWPAPVAHRGHLVLHAGGCRGPAGAGLERAQAGRRLGPLHSLAGGHFGRGPAAIGLRLAALAAGLQAAARPRHAARSALGPAASAQADRAWLRRGGPLDHAA